uniref:TDP43_N domain-containing protein n=1 Tax=Syphacia muris TaxID=451379 RepID=A0A0N5AL84_9BILA
MSIIGWVRLQIEPVDIQLENDDTLLLSAVQSAIPGAHGIYYVEDEQKKAFRYDASTGRKKLVSDS